MKRLTVLVSLTAASMLGIVPQAATASGSVHKPECDDNSPLCAEVFHSVGYAGGYTGHDEPALLFYSNAAGSGNSMTYRIGVPSEPPVPPQQDGTGGTYNFQLRPTFWLGLALCNDESSPNPGGSYVGPNIPCQPDSDSNIYNSPNPNSLRYIGRHPGTAFLELQFYPPGWAPFQAGGISCDATQWCVAMVIWSLAENDNTGQELNPTCAESVGGVEYPNFAFLTHNGATQAPANPVEATGATYTPDPSRDLFMNGGDQLTVSIHDTAHGLFTGVHDLTTGESGSVTASAANGFGEVKFEPAGKSCTNIPYDFHPMYSTSSPDTRVPWTAHSYNVSFSDEIGHFEYCGFAAPGSRKCAQPGATEQTKDGDDNFCFNASESLLVPITGCTDTDYDFDGVSYQRTWPGTFTNVARDQRLHPSSVLFTSPLTHGQNYSRIGFEADLPRIEFATNPPCQRHLSNPADPDPGAGCVNPPVGANFYPIFTTGTMGGNCVWQLGGTHIPGTTRTFGGSSTTEYGTNLLALFYPAANGQPQYIYEDYRRIISNPCSA